MYAVHSADMPLLAVFDDDCPTIRPLADLRASFEIRTGALRSLDRIERALGSVSELIVPERLLDLISERTESRVSTLSAFSGEEDVLVVNGRWTAGDELAAKMQALEPGEAILQRLSEKDDEPVLLAARGDRSSLAAAMAGDLAAFQIRVTDSGSVLRRPWDVIRLGKPNIASDAAAMVSDHARSAVPEGAFQRGSAPLLIADDCDVWPNVVFDTTKGPIVLGNRVVVRPNSTISGPVILGAGTQVLDHAVIRPHVATGPMVKLAGEVSGVIVQGYSNKGHDGFLGDSWLGEWVNLGAATTTSNLLNTYGEITSVAQPHGSRERTGLQFFGTVFGDHVKTAIDTRLMTGSVAHTGVMWAATRPVSGCVERFAWVTDDGQKSYRMDRFLSVARTVMARREIELSPAYERVLASLAE